MREEREDSRRVASGALWGAVQERRSSMMAAAGVEVEAAACASVDSSTLALSCSSIEPKPADAAAVAASPLPAQKASALNKVLHFLKIKTAGWARAAGSP
jgi:hypothetical protein